jgi:hypothetical protein
MIDLNISRLLRVPLRAIPKALPRDERELFIAADNAPGFLDFQRHRFAERPEGRLDLVEARGVVESEQTIDGFSIPAETTHQLGAGDAALAERAVE